MDKTAGNSLNSPKTLRHTLGHIDCPACQEVRAALICSLSAEMPFPDAAHAYMAMRSVDATPGALTARYIRENTEQSYRQYLASLELFFGAMKLGDIQWFHLRAYQQARAAGAEPFIRYRRPQDAKDSADGRRKAKGKTPCPAKPKKINQELGLLKHILERANCWAGELKDLYQPLIDDNEEIARALSPSEQATWLDVARMSERWNIVYWYSLFAFNTCMSTDEIRALRLGDVNLFQRTLVVRRGKVKSRSRTIELVGGEVLWAIEQLIRRAEDLGAHEPQHYLFPSRIGPGNWNPDAPMSESGIKKQWEEVRAASKLTWFRQYDCRHTAITRLSESGMPTDVIMARAGHVSEKMRRHYTHISQAAQRRWIEHANSMQRIEMNDPWARKAPSSFPFSSQNYASRKN